MSVYGNWKSASISANASKSSAIDLGRDYEFLNLEIPTMDTCKLWLEVSETLDGTYRTLGKDVTTDEENFGRYDVWKIGGYQYIKVVSSKPTVNGWSIRVRGMRA